MNDYNKKWCDERHGFVEKEFIKVRGLILEAIK